MPTHGFLLRPVYGLDGRKRYGPALGRSFRASSTPASKRTWSASSSMLPWDTHVAVDKNRIPLRPQDRQKMGATRASACPPSCIDSNSVTNRQDGRRRRRRNKISPVVVLGIRFVEAAAFAQTYRFLGHFVVVFVLNRPCVLSGLSRKSVSWIQTSSE